MEMIPLTELKGESKMSRLRHKPDPERKRLRKPEWIRIDPRSNGNVHKVKKQLRDLKLHTVCEEASCPNLAECFSKRTATFMIMGAICTRRCPFCDVAHGRPMALDPDEPRHVAESIQTLNLRYAVITSVDRDDLDDGGAQHIADTVYAIRDAAPHATIEILTPDFLRKGKAAEIAIDSRPDVFNHNLETVPRLYLSIRPGARYYHSLRLLERVKERDPSQFTKSGLMVGLGETKEEVMQVMDDMRSAGVDFITIGQYLQPTRKHAAVDRYVTPDEF